MIKRIWRGWTTPANAAKYEEILRTHVFPGIEAKKIPGYRRIELLRMDREAEVEFMTIMTFDSLENIIAFQGADYARAYVPDRARAVLSRWDEISAHYEVREERQYG